MVEHSEVFLASSLELAKELRHENVQYNLSKVGGRGKADLELFQENI